MTSKSEGQATAAGRTGAAYAPTGAAMPTAAPKLRRYCAGVYRVTLTDDLFGQIQRTSDDDWIAEIRERETGNLKRYAGRWSTVRAAHEELASIPRVDL